MNSIKITDVGIFNNYIAIIWVGGVVDLVTLALIQKGCVVPRQYDNKELELPDKVIIPFMNNK